LVYLYSPQSYRVSGDSILIRRLVGTVRLPLDSIRELRAGAADDFRQCARLWGSGGVFGYFGLFKTVKLGECRWYMRNRTRSFLPKVYSIGGDSSRTCYGATIFE
jgi:hypothetical protein